MKVRHKKPTLLSIGVPLLALGFLGQCSLFESKKTLSLTLEKRPTRSFFPARKQRELIVSDRRFQQANQFDRLVAGQMAASERKQLNTKCRKNPKHSPFCYSIRRPIALGKAIYRKQKKRPTKAPKKREFFPATIKIDKRGRVRNWNQLRRIHKRSLIKGMELLDLDALKILSRKVKKEKRCPNNLTVSVAASMEDYLPKQVSPREVATLYEYATRCTKRKSADRENFLTRAGLLHFFNKDYRAAEAVLKRVKPTDYYNGRSLYWLARSQAQNGAYDRAGKTIQRLIRSHPFSFHATVASLSERPERLASYLGTALPPTTRSSNWKLNRLIEQMELLNRYGFAETSSIIGNWAFKSFPRMKRTLRLYLISLSSPNDKVTLLAPIVARRPRYINRPLLEMYYPKAFIDYFIKHDGKVDPYLMLAIARKESVFDPYAVSVANAQGLMQINPKMVETNYEVNNADILEIENNVAIGAAYVNKLVRKFRGRLPYVLTAYNAGEDKALAWRNRFPGVDPILYVDLIPYRETRNYVGFVMSNYFWYRRLYQNDDGELIAQLFNSGKAIAISK